MARCPRCGAANDPRAASCAQCGTTLGAALPGADARALDATQAAAARDAAARDAAARAVVERGVATRRPPAPRTQREAGRRPGARPSAGRVLLPIVLALTLAVLLQRLPATGIAADSLAFRMLRPAGGTVMALVPALIVFLFAWTSTELLLRAWAGRTARRDLRRPEIGQLPDIVGREPFQQTLQRLRSTGRGILDRPVGQRVAWMLHHLDGVEPRRAHQLLLHRADLDAAAMADGYRTIRLTTWAIPVLGFLGTALSMRRWAGGYAEVVDASVNVEELAAGLSVALDPTLLGLLAGLVALVLGSLVRSRVERTQGELDELSLEMVAHIPGGGGRPSGSGDGPAGRDLSVRDGLDALALRTGQLQEAIQSGIEGLNHAIADMRIGVTGLGDRIAQIENANQKLAASIAEFGARLESFRDAQTALTPVLRQLAGPLELRLTPTGPDHREPSIPDHGERAIREPRGHDPRGHERRRADRRDPGARPSD